MQSIKINSNTVTVAEIMYAKWYQQHKGCQFTVRVERDKTADEMKNLFYEVSKLGDPAKTVQEGDDSFVCCISSHGGWDPDLNKDVVAIWTDRG